MRGELLGNFVWMVSDEGYRWSDLIGFGPRDGPPTLVPKSECRGRPYHPLRKEPALFRTFAAVPPTPEGILAFADQFGNLRERTILRDLEGGRSPWAVGGESLDAWQGSRI